MSYDIRDVRNLDGLINYFIDELNWNIDLDDFDEIDDITYDFDASDIGLKDEAFAKIASLRQLQPISDYQKWGVFCIEFDSDKFVVSALRKILSGLIPKRRNAAEHAVWKQRDLLFLCFWGKDNNRTIGIAHFEDKEKGLPQIKMISCAPAVEDFTQINVFEERLKYLSWVKDESDTEAWYNQWSSAFMSAYREVIHTSSALTIKLAEEARKIRERILEIYDIETEKGYVHNLFKDFKNNLIHDMTKEQFADMYAQTIVYGLFSARCMDETIEDFSAKEAVDCIPITNPFLKKLMEECLGEGTKHLLTFDELEVSNVVDILLHTNTKLILRDFNRQTGGGKEDPVIHFYEEFLTAYDKTQKVQRGVFYTPQPIVNFMVRAVDCILKTEFGLEDGLASEEQKEILVEIDGKKRRERQRVPAVQILDPATGTGTFIRQTILQIYENFREKHKGESEEQIKSAWNQYVPKHLLPRLNAFELMMAPYAVAHMKLAMVLKDTGYDFWSNHRLKVFLTNSLEEAGNISTQICLFGSNPLAFESVEANKAKKNNGINIVIGNPPYSGESANKGDWIMSLMEDYKKEPGGKLKLQERNPKWINDDYVKFIRYAQHLIEQSGNGIIAFINPHGFIDNPTFRGMRWKLLTVFDRIYILDLHGNVNKKEKCPDGSKDENVFDIQQGVCIVLLVKNIDKQNEHLAKVYRSDLYGLRKDKYDELNNRTFNIEQYDIVENSAPEFFFYNIDNAEAKTYKAYFSLAELFIEKSLGIVTAKDKVLVGYNKSSLKNQVVNYYQNNIEERLIHTVNYRPFDNRYIYYDTNLVERARNNTMPHLQKDNIGLIFRRQSPDAMPVGYVFVSNNMVADGYIRSDNKGGENVAPLYLYDTSFEGTKRLPNFNMDIINKISRCLGIKFFSINNEDETNSFSSLDLFDYIYSVLYSNRFRTKYNNFLKIDYPRIPYPTDIDVFWQLVELGSKLRECHLMQVEFDTTDYGFIGEGTNEVVKSEYKNGKVYISKTQYFDNVPQSQWGQYIGGYQPLQKWLKDRKKTILSDDDIEHYKKIIAALKMTEELMAEIDEIVEF